MDYWYLMKCCIAQGLWTSNIRGAAENVVCQMDLDAVIQEAEIGRSLIADDVVCIYLYFYAYRNNG
jgi:hypothetical protein